MEIVTKMRRVYLSLSFFFFLSHLVWAPLVVDTYAVVGSWFNFISVFVFLLLNCYNNRMVGNKNTFLLLLLTVNIIYFLARWFLFVLI